MMSQASDVRQTCPICGGAVAPSRRGRARTYCSTRCTSTAGQRRKRAADKERLSKVTRLAIAGAVAPRLRSKIPGRRRIHVVGADGEVVRSITDVELASGMLARGNIEFQVDDPERGLPTFTCAGCGRVTSRKAQGAGAKFCIECRNGKCSDCGGLLPSESTAREARKRGREPRCQPCWFAFRRRALAAPSKLTRKQLEARVAELESLVEATQRRGAE